jgi:hypothetical protein
MTPEQIKEIEIIVRTMMRVPIIYLWVAIGFIMFLLVLFLVVGFFVLKTQEFKIEKMARNVESVKNIANKIHEDMLLLQDWFKRIEQDMHELKKKDWS